MKGHDMLISPCNKILCTEAGIQQCDFEEVCLCQKSSVKAEPLNGSTMPKATVLSSAQKAKMCLSTTVLLLVMVTDRFLKVRKLNSLQLAATKAGKRRKCRRDSQYLSEYFNRVFARLVYSRLVYSSANNLAVRS